MEKQIEVLNESVTTIADREGKYLTFMLAGEEYGIEIAKAREIMGMMPITSIPKVPDFIKGVEIQQATKGHYKFPHQF